MKNNLFTYATSELSQDAFLCWLMSYAMKDAKKDEALRRCAVAFLKQFVPPIKTLEDGEIYVSNIERQHGKIDVLLTLEGGYKIIVEDKTFTSDHDEQLTRYKDLLISEGVNPELVYGIYYKTGFESDTSNAEKAGYAVFDRKRILSILNANSSGMTNDIFLDYLDYYNTFESETQRYKILPVEQWDWKMIQGYYYDLKKAADFRRGSLDGAFNYGYVANPSGGFYGMWLFSQTALYYGAVEFYPYLQMEFNNGAINICAKLYIENDMQSFKPSELKDMIAYNNTQEWKYDLEQFGYFKPSRLSSGKTMTVGTIWREPRKDISCAELTNSLQSTVDGFEQFMLYCKAKAGET